MDSDTKRNRPLVLVVDDTAVTAELIRSTLVSLDLDVEMAVDGEKGLSKGLDLKQDLIILERLIFLMLLKCAMGREHVEKL